jgi:peroxiredoxin
LCTVRDERQEYADLNADVYGISVDSPFTLQKFRADNELPYPLLSDFNKEASRAYSALYDNFVFDMKGVSKRAAFVINKKGVIQYAEVLEDAGQLPNFEEIKSSLQKLNA